MTLIAWGHEDYAPQLVAIRSIVTADLAADALGGGLVRELDAWQHEGDVLDAVRALGTTGSRT